MIVDCARYDRGARLPQPVRLEEVLSDDRPEGFVWIGLYEPTPEEFDVVTRSFGLHPLAVEDAIKAHQRPKLERYGSTWFLVLKPARYVDHDELVELGQLMLFVGDRFVVTVRHGETGALQSLRLQLEDRGDELAWGPSAVLHAVTDKVVDDYATVVRELEIDIDEIEQAVFSHARAGHAERIFKLKREVLDFRRAVDPLVEPLTVLERTPPPIDERLAPYFRDVRDHVLRIAEHVSVLDSLLDSALNANVAQVAMQQNEDMRKISAWVAIVAVPTLIAGIYGMNFAYMPELEWRFGYPLALALMLAVAGLLYRTFRRRHWL